MRTTESEEKKHESYGLLSLSRTQVSPPCALFGSSIRHGNTICLKISEGIERRDFQRSWYMDGKKFIEVEMSAAQFAEAITTLNVGCGVPVTVRYVKGDEYNKDNRRFRENPPEINFKDRAQSELKSEMKELGERIEELSKDAKEVLERKGTTIKAGEKEKLLKDLMFLVQEIQSNIPFAHECFQKSVEHTVVEAKSEVDSCMTAMREKLGQAVLDHKIEIPMLEDIKKPSKHTVTYYKDHEDCLGDELDEVEITVEADGNFEAMQKADEILIKEKKLNKKDYPDIDVTPIFE